MELAHKGLTKDEDIDAMLSLPQVDELVDAAAETGLTADQWRRVLRSPAITDLVRLKIGTGAPIGIIYHLESLPRLHTLDLSLTTGGSSVDASALMSLPALTSLGLTCVDPGTNRTIFPAIAACTRLTHLRMEEAMFRRGDFEPSLNLGCDSFLAFTALRVPELAWMAPLSRIARLSRLESLLIGDDDHSSAEYVITDQLAPRSTSSGAARFERLAQAVRETTPDDQRRTHSRRTVPRRLDVDRS